MTGHVAMADRQERRKSVLSDDDVERIGEAFDKKISVLCETIGYDITTPDSRSEIRKDHEFVRDSRKAKGRIVAAILTAMGTAIGGAAMANADILTKIFGGQ